ncbi:MAG: hypothetical protein OR993_05945, partial [Candidatus Poseidoniales archaeon]|nr:hypothetical protein [Candidatus Poseidoniales archaeon]
MTPDIGGARSRLFRFKFKKESVYPASIYNKNQQKLVIHSILPIGYVIPLTRNPVDPAGGYRYW